MGSRHHMNRPENTSTLLVCVACVNALIRNTHSGPVQTLPKALTNAMKQVDLVSCKVRNTRVIPCIFTPNQKDGNASVRIPGIGSRVGHHLLVSNTEKFLSNCTPFTPISKEDVHQWATDGRNGHKFSIRIPAIVIDIRRHEPEMHFYATQLDATRQSTKGTVHYLDVPNAINYGFLKDRTHLGLFAAKYVPLGSMLDYCGLGCYSVVWSITDVSMVVGDISYAADGPPLIGAVKTMFCPWHASQCRPGMLINDPSLDEQPNVRTVNCVLTDMGELSTYLGWSNCTTTGHYSVRLGVRVTADVAAGQELLASYGLYYNDDVPR